MNIFQIEELFMAVLAVVIIVGTALTMSGVI